MHIDPNLERYSDTFNLQDEEEAFKNFVESLKAEGKEVSDVIVASSDSELNLKKLQDDLRKIGYRQQFKK